MVAAVHQKPGCGTHQAYIMARGGTQVIGELTALHQVMWSRVRDDISTARVRVGAVECCDLLSKVGTIQHELHIFRDGVPVWEGPITRLEFEWDEVSIYAEDILWVAKRRVNEYGWNLETTPWDPAGTTTIYLAMLVLINVYYGGNGFPDDDWNMGNRIHSFTTPKDQRSFSAVNAYQFTSWQILDDMARYWDLDYTVVGRTIFLFDIHTNWREEQTLVPDHIAQYPSIVEYGNQYGNRYFRTDGSGYAGIGNNSPDPPWPPKVDILSNATGEEEEVPTEVPSAAKLKLWTEAADRNVKKITPPKTSIVVPNGATLLPSSPWNVSTLTPGSWFWVSYAHSCRDVAEYHRLQSVKVTEEGGKEEDIRISTTSAPSDMIRWTP